MCTIGLEISRDKSTGNPQWTTGLVNRSHRFHPATASKRCLDTHDHFARRLPHFLVWVRECVCVAVAESVHSTAVPAVTSIYYSGHRWLQAYLWDFQQMHNEFRPVNPILAHPSLNCFGYPLKFHTKYPTHTLKDMFLYNIKILRALKFKSSYTFFKRPRRASVVWKSRYLSSHRLGMVIWWSWSTFWKSSLN